MSVRTYSDNTLYISEPRLYHVMILTAIFTTFCWPVSIIVC
jgi:hypothetical protein